ncbi:MAG: TetR/AcrR family transcriptional regulator [Streptosporangiaceae bacterium]
MPRIRRDGIDGLAVADLMTEAGLTHGGFYRHFESREHLVTEAAQRALSQGSAWTMAAARLGGQRGYGAFGGLRVPGAIGERVLRCERSGRAWGSCPFVES